MLPAVTTLVPSGLNATLQFESLVAPRVVMAPDPRSQTLTVPCRSVAASRRPSRLKARLSIALVEPVTSFLAVPEARTRTVPPSPAAAIVWPSGLTATAKSTPAPDCSSFIP